MELATITMPKAEARTAFLEYRRAVRERHDAEDEMIMRGYRALSQGRTTLARRRSAQNRVLTPTLRLWWPCSPK